MGEEGINPKNKRSKDAALRRAYEVSRADFAAATRDRFRAAGGAYGPWTPAPGQPRAPTGSTVINCDSRAAERACVDGVEGAAEGRGLRRRRRRAASPGPGLRRLHRPPTGAQSPS